MLRVHLLGRLSVTAGDAVVDEAELPGRQGRLALPSWSATGTDRSLAPSWPRRCGRATRLAAGSLCCPLWSAGCGRRALARGDSAGARDSAATAVELARQPLLPGYVGEWLDARREQLRGSLITGLEVLARAAEPAAAVRHAAEALALEPFR
ncbi:MAG: hypothetical protein ACRDRF_19395, partial [Pseudonocardiaceae bacterium]